MGYSPGTDDGRASGWSAPGWSLAKPAAASPDNLALTGFFDIVLGGWIGGWVIHYTRRFRQLEARMEAWWG